MLNMENELTMGAETEVHREIRRSVREFVEREIVPIAGELDNAEAEIPMSVIRHMAELGYFGLIFPEKYGGMGLDARSMALGRLGDDPHDHHRLAALDRWHRGAAAALPAADRLRRAPHRRRVHRT
jgi:alkylation response protein AidB-like acyl-CoA dehydrogenase